MERITPFPTDVALTAALTAALCAGQPLDHGLCRIDILRAYVVWCGTRRTDRIGARGAEEAAALFLATVGRAGAVAALDVGRADMASGVHAMQHGMAPGVLPAPPTDEAASAPHVRAGGLCQLLGADTYAAFAAEFTIRARADCWQAETRRLDGQIAHLGRAASVGSPTTHQRARLVTLRRQRAQALANHDRARTDLAALHAPRGTP